MIHNQISIIISICSNELLQDVISLNQKYLLQNIPFDKLNIGFIKIAYTNNQLIQIIKNGEIVIAHENGCLIGYNLVGSASDNKLLDYQKKSAGRLAESKSLDILRIGYGVQVCIDEPYHNKGLYANMLRELVNNVAAKYDYLLCSVSDENSRSLNVHLKFGWKLFERSGNVNYLILRTNEY